MRGLCQLAIRRIEGFRPKAAEVLEGTEVEALAYSDFPYEHHVGLRTDNVQERTDASSSAAAAGQNASPPFLRLRKCRPRGPGGPRGRSADCGNGLSAQYIRLGSEINQTESGSVDIVKS